MNFYLEAKGEKKSLNTPSYSLFALSYQLKLHLHLRMGGRACALCGALLSHTLTLEKAFVRILDLCGEIINLDTVMMY